MLNLSVQNTIPEKDAAQQQNEKRQLSVIKTAPKSKKEPNNDKLYCKYCNIPYKNFEEHKQDKTHFEKYKLSIYCEICNVSCPGTVEQHKRGKKHVKKLIEVTRKLKKKEKNEQLTVVVKKNVREVKARRRRNKTPVKSKTKLLRVPEPDKTESVASSSNNHKQKNKSSVNKDMDFPNMIHNIYDDRIQANQVNFPPPNFSSSRYHDRRYFSNDPYQNHPHWINYPPVNNDFRFNFPTQNYGRPPNYKDVNLPYFNRNVPPPNFVGNRNRFIWEAPIAGQSDFSQASQSQHQQINPFYANESQYEKFDSDNESKSICSQSVTPKEKETGDATKILNKESSAHAICEETSKAFGAISPRSVNKELKKRRLSKELKRMLRKKSSSASLTVSPDNNETPKADCQISEKDAEDEQQKIKEYTNTLLEANDGQISRLIHPSNYKDKAAVDHLITNLSKSIRKKNHCRFKLRSNSMCSSSTNDEDDDNIHEQSKVDESVSSESEAISSQYFSDSNLNEKNCHTDSAVNSYKKSTNSSQSEKDVNSNSSKSEKSITDVQISTNKNESGRSEVISQGEMKKSKSNSQFNQSSSSGENMSNSKYQIITVNPKNKTESKKTSKEEDPSVLSEREKQPKRKSNSSDTKNKKQKSDTGSKSTKNEVGEKQDLQKNCDKMSENPDEISEKFPSVETSELPPIKSELPCCPEKTAAEVPTSLSNPPAENANTGFSVDALINLFASGDVVVKDEFSDPLIDAIQNIDPSVLMNACSTTTSTSTTSSNSAPVTSTPIYKMPNNSTTSSNPVPVTCTPIYKVPNNSITTTSCTPTFSTPIQMSAESSTISSGLSNQAPTISTPISSFSGNFKPSSTWSNQRQPISTPVQKISSNSNSIFSEAMPESTEINQERANCVSPLIFGLNVTDNDTPSVTSDSHDITDNVLNQTSLRTEESNCSSPLSCSMSEYSVFDDIEFMPKNKSQYTPHLKELVKQLQQISSEEKVVKRNLEEARNKITDFQLLLAEWKYKKKQLRDEEEKLLKKRTDIIELMQVAVKTSNKDSPSSEREEHLSENHSQSSSDSSLVYKAKYQKVGHMPNLKGNNSSRQTEIILSTEPEILVIPVKKKKPEVIVIEEDDQDPLPEESEHMSDEECEGSFYKAKDMSAHTTVVNSIMVFEDCLYTSSNDFTAKRFKLKDPNEIVTYMHSSKNVTEVVVEKVQNEALVFTSCTNKLLSLFIASNGTKIKTYFEPSAIMSICKGWGKFFAGLADGSINVFNWKYEESEMVKSEYPASRIATAHQGRIHVLIILTSNGNISVRDAETGLLIRHIKGFVKLPSWLTVYNDLAYLSSSDKTLTVLDIMTGRAEKKLYVSTNTTGLAVYEDFVFTISYTGYVNCYNKEKMSDKKLYYGAGKNGLTCIYVHHDWVFTGNRKGDVSVFKFEPSDGITCQFGHCCLTFGLISDLEYHVEKDHLSKKNNVRCGWAMCKYPFHEDWTIKDKMQHLNKHIPRRKRS